MSVHILIINTPSEWMNEWMNEWINEWIYIYFFIKKIFPYIFVEAHKMKFYNLN